MTIPTLCDSLVLAKVTVKRFNALGIGTSLILFRLIIDIGGRYMMVFDYADNGSLRKYLSTPAIKLDWPANCQLGLDIVSGLIHIHKAGILHKDLVSVLLVNTSLMWIVINIVFSYVITSLRTMY